MSYIRLSLMRPHQGQDGAVRQLLDDLVLYHESQPGYLTGYRVEHAEGDRVGRLGIWEHEADAARVAITDRDMALRSQLNLLVAEGSHEEMALLGHWAPKT